MLVIFAESGRKSLTFVGERDMFVVIFDNGHKKLDIALFV
jgi:hypothetical protein